MDEIRKCLEKMQTDVSSAGLLAEIIENEKESDIYKLFIALLDKLIENELSKDSNEKWCNI